MFDLFDFDNFLENPLFGWNKDSYKFNRNEKDMHPYSFYKNEKAMVIVHNVLGVDKKDLKIQTFNANTGITLLTIQGKTVDVVTGKEYSVESEFSLDSAQIDLDKATSSMKNGLLYITIPYAEIKKETKGTIEIK